MILPSNYKCTQSSRSRGKAMLNGTPRDSSIPIAFQHSKIRCWWCRLLPEVGLYLVFYSIYWNPYTYVQDPSRVFHDLQSSYSHELLISQIWMFLSCKSLPFEDPRMKKRVLQLLRVVIRFVVIKENPPVVWNQTPKEFRHFRRLCYLMMSIDVVFFVLNWSPNFWFQHRLYVPWHLLQAFHTNGSGVVFGWLFRST